jgi:hypothetical protein
MLLSSRPQSSVFHGFVVLVWNVGRLEEARKPKWRLQYAFCCNGSLKSLTAKKLLCSIRKTRETEPNNLIAIITRQLLEADYGYKMKFSLCSTI